MKTRWTTIKEALIWCEKDMEQVTWNPRGRAQNGDHMAWEM